MAIPGDAVYRGKITVQNSKVSGSSDHSNFPVLLTEDNFWAELMDAGSESATNGGGGLRFSSDEAGAIQLAHEVVSFVTSATEGSRAAEVWIKAPTLAYSTDTDIHVWSSPTASEEAATSTYGSEAVWADYEAVLHLNDASTIVDSTGNRTPTLSGTLTSVDGPWGDAIQFGGSQYITLADDAGLDSLTGTVQNRAISMLLNFTTTSNLVIAEKGTNKHFVTQTFDGSHAGKAGFRTNTTSTDTAYGPQINNGAWHLFRGGQDNVNNYAVADTVKVSKTATASAPADDGDDFVIGSRLGSYGYTGKIKELRLRNQWPSDDWDATEYNNLLAPATFAIAGTFQTGGGTAHSLALSESIGASAVNSALWAIAANTPESIAATSTQSASAAFAVSASESAAASSAQSSSGATAVTVSESSALTSAQSAWLKIVASASESAAMSDAESVAIVSGLVAVTVSESINATSAQAVNQAASISVAESANTASDQSASAAFATAVAEAVAAADIQSISFALESSISEALATGSAQASLISIDGAVSETIGTTSTQSAAAAFAPSVAFSAAVVEAVITAAAYQTSYADSIQAVSVESIGIAGETVSFTITVQRKAVLATHVATATLN